MEFWGLWDFVIRNDGTLEETRRRQRLSGNL